MLTAIADAYYDSLPVLFITAHNSDGKKTGMRIENNQEMDTISLVSGITKYASRVDQAEEAQRAIETAITLAQEGRKGPVVLDFHSAVFKQEIRAEEGRPGKRGTEAGDASREAARKIAARVRSAARPIFLIGNGIHQAGVEVWVERLAAHAGVPVLSSRTAQDVMPASPLYFGFVGSHATRYSSFILSKADLIVALGNRLAFPIRSPSFRPVMEKVFTVRIDVDEGEFLREVPNSENLAGDIRELLLEALKEDFAYSGSERWLSVCGELRNALWQWDRCPEVDALMCVMKRAGQESIFVCDVGNHGFWVTNAYAYAGVNNRILYSGSFGSLGSALPKAIGAHYGSGRRIFCFTGDQGFQMNIQELQLISQQKLPIVIVLVNNRSSGMIREREAQRYGKHFVHTTESSGYSVPDIRAISGAYGLDYHHMEAAAMSELPSFGDGPCVLEIETAEDASLSPNLPRGNACQDMEPPLPRELYAQLDSLR